MCDFESPCGANNGWPWKPYSSPSGQMLANVHRLAFLQILLLSAGLFQAEGVLGAQGNCPGAVLREAPPIYTPNDDFPVTDGPVLDMKVIDGTLYLGGQFDHLGTHTGGLVAFGEGGPILDRSWPKVEGSVLAIAEDGSGGWYIGGDFTRVGSYLRTGMAHLFPDKTVDPCFNPSLQIQVDWWNERVPGIVSMIAVSQMAIYVGGTFDRIGDEERKSIAALDAVNGSVLPWDPQLTVTAPPWVEIAVISNLMITGDTLYVCGRFDRIGEKTRRNLASFDAMTGRLLDWAPNPNGRVEAVGLAGGVLYVAGGFTKIGGRHRRYLAALEPKTGRVLSWNPSPDEPPYLLAADRKAKRLYVAGDFSLIAGQPRNYLACFRLDRRKLIAWAPEPDGPVMGLLPLPGKVFICGGFSRVGGEKRPYVAALNPETAAPSAWAPIPNDWVMALAGKEGMFLAGGYLSSVGAVERQSLAAVDLATGSVTPWAPNIKGAVHVLEPKGETVYLAGAFPLSEGGLGLHSFAAVDRANGGLKPWELLLPDGLVAAFVPLQDKLYAGGNFVVIHSPSCRFGWACPERHGLLALDITTGDLLDWAPLQFSDWGGTT